MHILSNMKIVYLSSPLEEFCHIREDAKEIKNENLNKLLFKQIKTNLKFINLIASLWTGVYLTKIFLFLTIIYLFHLYEVKPNVGILV